MSGLQDPIGIDPLFLVVIVFILIFCAFSSETVATADRILVSRFGRFHRELGPGVHFIWIPWEAVSFRATTREQILDTEPQQCYTKDNAPLTVDAMLFYRIENVFNARYHIQDLRAGLYNLVMTQLRAQIGKLTLEECLSARDSINRQLLESVNKVASSWGVQVTRVEIQELTPSESIRFAMELQLKAERGKRATILNSEGEKARLISKSEGQAKAAQIQAQAQKETMELLAQANVAKQQLEAEGLRQALDTLKASTDSPEQVLLWKLYAESLQQMAASENAKIIMLPSKDSVPGMTWEGFSKIG